MDEAPVRPELPPGDAGGMTLAGLRARRDEILRVAATFGAQNVRVFGSAARGQERPDSDVDFLVDLPSRYRGFEYFGALDQMREALEDVLGYKVDVVSIRGMTPQTEAMVDRIRQEAVPL